MAMTSEDIQAIVEGRTIASEFLKTVATNADRTAIRWREGDEAWGQFSYQEYADKVASMAGWYRDLGIEPGDRIVLMMRNNPDFHICDMAAYFCGATAVSIYNSSSSEQIDYLVNHCGAVLAVVENQSFLDRFLAVRDQLTSVKNIVMLHGDPPEGVLGASADPGVSIDLAEGATRCSPDQLATVIYTSGTTGPPKGVMLTHNNITWTVESMRQLIPWEDDDFVGKRVISYLPMAHIAERVTSHYAGAFFGYEITTCPDTTALASYLKDVRPNFVFGVPRVWEKLYAGVNAALSLDPDRAAQFNEGVEAAKPLSEKIDWGTATEEEKGTWDFLQAVFAGVRELIGVDQVDFAVTGAAPIPAEMLRWFRAIGIPLSEVYGMSENTGPMTWTAVKVKAGSVGPAIPGCEVELAEDGEIICRGGNVFQGYLNDPEKTAEGLDDDGWLHSGDIGEVDEDGYFSVVDRKKELIITAGGKNVSPANLEAALKMISIVGQAAAIGDKRPFVSALVVLDPDAAPAWATAKGISGLSLAELAEHDEIVAEIERGLEEAMAGFNNAERVKRVKVIGEEWLPDSDVLTPTSKLKRRGIHVRYEAEIEALYR